MDRLDYAQTDDGDLLFLNGDLVVVESSQEHIEQIISSHKGDYRENPALGVDPQRHINEPVGKTNALLISIRKELERDGFTVKQVKYDGEEVVVNAR